MSVYEVHLGSWLRHPDGRSLGYRELRRAAGRPRRRPRLHPRRAAAGHRAPLRPSWGYQVTGYFAPTARYGDPDDFRDLVDHLHRRGIGVIVDWVPAHFPRDEWALARFDGTALYEHADPRQGEHPDWGTLVFNYGRTRSATSSSPTPSTGWRSSTSTACGSTPWPRCSTSTTRGATGEWVPNRHGGRENLEAIAFLQEINTVVHRDIPGVLTIAEESTAWPGVSPPGRRRRPGVQPQVEHGLDARHAASTSPRDPVHRRWHHDLLTFGLIYAWSENFVLPLSHDEVVHGKGSLLGKMPGDQWQRFANLRALYGWMWAHPGKQLLFMGAELAQEREWSHDREIDWYLARRPPSPGRARPAARAQPGRGRASRRCGRATRCRPASAGSTPTTARARSTRSSARRGPGPRRLRRLCGPVACVANLTPVPRHGYRLGLPSGGPVGRRAQHRRRAVGRQRRGPARGGDRRHPVAGPARLRRPHPPPARRPLAGPGTRFSPAVASPVVRPVPEAIWVVRASPRRYGSGAARYDLGFSGSTPSPRDR